MKSNHQRRVKGFSAALSLYRSDLLFRSLVDLAACGTIVLVCAGLFFPPLDHLYRKAVALVGGLSTAQHEDAHVTSPASVRPVVGRFANASLLRRPTLADAGPTAAAVTSRAQAKLDHGDFDMAYDIIADADHGGPEIATARAIMLINSCKCANNFVALMRLRQAAEHGYGPAFTMLGRADLMMIAGGPLGPEPYDAGNALAVLPQTDRPPALLSIDATGHPISVTANVLQAEAVSWFERGAAFGDATALRGLGVAQAQGLTGKPNLSAAIAYFHDAASRGDGPSAAELGMMYSLGAGVVADRVQAERYLRQAVTENYEPALLPLSLILMRKADEKDLRTAHESFDLAYRASNSADPLTAMNAEHLIAMLHLEAAPPVLRNMNTAYVHARRAYGLGDDAAAAMLARMFHLGIGVTQDPLDAGAFALLSKEAGTLPDDLRPLVVPDAKDRKQIENRAAEIKQARSGGDKVSAFVKRDEVRTLLTTSKNIPSFKPLATELK